MLVVKVPGINGLGKTRGCESAASEIINSLKTIYSKEDGTPVDVEKINIQEFKIDNSNIELANKVIYEDSLEIFKNSDRVVFLGGDHSISYSLTKAFLKYCLTQEKEPCLIVFDAHPDCMPLQKSLQEVPTHEEWLRAVVESGFPAENILLVGVRNSYKDETEFINNSGIKKLDINFLLTDLEESCNTIMEFSSNKQLYVSLDIDVVDPVFAPATGYREPGGLTSRELIYLFQRINKIKNLKAMDIVEVNPALEKEKPEKNTVKLGAKILAEVLR